MRAAFDRRVVPETALAFVRACQQRVPCHLGGGAALSGAYLAHRLSNDLDLFVHGKDSHRLLVSVLNDAAASVGAVVSVRQDAGGHVRAELALSDRTLELDVVHDSLTDIEPPPPPIDGVVIESLTDLRAAKVTCLLSRSEPRDLVDVLFLERAGFPPDADLPLALRKDAGVDPGVLAWLLRDFPLEPMPMMLEPLTHDELRSYRDELCMRFKQMAVGDR